MTTDGEGKPKHEFMEPCGQMEGKDSCWYCGKQRVEHPEKKPAEGTGGGIEARTIQLISDSVNAAHAAKVRPLVEALQDIIQQVKLWRNIVDAKDERIKEESNA